MTPRSRFGTKLTQPARLRAQFPGDGGRWVHVPQQILHGADVVAGQQQVGGAWRPRRPNSVLEGPLEF
jgi:hypothetical protein